METCSYNCQLQIRLKTFAVGYLSSHFGIQKHAHKPCHGSLMLPLEHTIEVGEYCFQFGQYYFLGYVMLGIKYY